MKNRYTAIFATIIVLLSVSIVLIAPWESQKYGNSELTMISIDITKPMTNKDVDWPIENKGDNWLIESPIILKIQSSQSSPIELKPDSVIVQRLGNSITMIHVEWNELGLGALHRKALNLFELFELNDDRLDVWFQDRQANVPSNDPRLQMHFNDRNPPISIRALASIEVRGSWRLLLTVSPGLQERIRRLKEVQQ